MTTTTKRPTSATAVSRHLRDVGFSPVAAADRNRQGLRVTSALWGRVRVEADLDVEREANDLAIAARQALIGAGFVVQASPNDPAAFYVTGRSS